MELKPENSTLFQTGGMSAGKSQHSIRDIDGRPQWRQDVSTTRLRGALDTSHQVRSKKLLSLNNKIHAQKGTDTVTTSAPKDEDFVDKAILIGHKRLQG